MPPPWVMRQPSSAKHSAPMRQMKPHSSQMMREAPTDPDSISTPLGETNIPLPTMTPMIMVAPLNSVRLRLSFTVSDPPSLLDEEPSSAERPMVAYDLEFWI